MTRPLIITSDHLVNAAGWAAVAVIAVAAVKVATWKRRRAA
jgi:hypothetical protein